ncbi:hypothetical protein BDZ91DRAFT_284277 [Kalaharituber pfeilii]|nr:hypothetical protein BDZ91DRAFT_284277 [Kalaharituber pfeilii]
MIYPVYFYCLYLFCFLGFKAVQILLVDILDRWILFSEHLWPHYSSWNEFGVEKMQLQ